MIFSLCQSVSAIKMTFNVYLCWRCLIHDSMLHLGGLLPFSPREWGEQGGQACQKEQGKYTYWGEQGEQAHQGAQASWEEKAPTGRIYPSGIASPDEPEGEYMATSSRDTQNSFAIVTIHRVFKQLVVCNFLCCQSSHILRKHTSNLLFQQSHLLIYQIKSKMLVI